MIYQIWKKEVHIKHVKKFIFKVPRVSDLVTKHTDLDGPIVSKKLLLHQNWLQLNRKYVKFIVRYSPYPVLSTFLYLDTFSCIFL